MLERSGGGIALCLARQEGTGAGVASAGNLLEVHSTAFELADDGFTVGAASQLVKHPVDLDIWSHRR